MSNYEIIEQLTDIVARQSKMICELFGMVSRLCDTSLDSEVELLKTQTDELLDNISKVF